MTNTQDARDTATSATVSGTLARVIFAAKDTAFVIGILDTGSGCVTVKGEFPGYRFGGYYRITGTPSTDNYGGHIKIETIEVSIPTSEPALLKHLQSFDGVGPATARMLVSAFGLAVVEAIKTKTNAEIRAAAPRLDNDEVQAMRDQLLLEEKDFRTRAWLRDYLGSHWTERRARSALAHFGEATIEAALTGNPWSLAEIDGVGFVTADAVALERGCDKRSVERARAGILHAVDVQRDSGNTAHSTIEVITTARGLLSLEVADEPLLEEELQRLIDVGRMSVANAGKLQLDKDARAEREIAKWLVDRDGFGPVVHAGGHQEPDGFFEDQLAEDQSAALRAALAERTFVLTGAPGTGKTWLVRAFLTYFMPSRVILCAPTGKAAKRMVEMTGMFASTVHRTLAPLPLTDTRGKTIFTFSHGKNNPINADLIVIDEMSMMDCGLTARLLEAIRPTTYVLFVGDHYQLPSVGPGSVLRDLLASGVPQAELKTIKRQDPGLIVQQCHAVKDGHVLPVPKSKDQDMFMMERTAVETISATIVALYMDRLRTVECAAERPIESIQIISPLRERGVLATKALNEAIQAARLAAGETQKEGNLTFNVGDKVIQRKNDYKLGIVNGDIGIIASVTATVGGSTCYEVLFDGVPEPVLIPRVGNNLQLAYALTVHSMQGSEAPIIVMPVHESLGYFFDRTILYTGISRASKMVVLVGSERFLATIARRTKSIERQTALQEAIGAERQLRAFCGVDGPVAKPQAGGVQI